MLIRIPRNQLLTYKRAKCVEHLLNYLEAVLDIAL